MFAQNPQQHGRGVYCNRTLNLRSIRAIGYDMDYTLIHYHVEEWERRAPRSIFVSATPSKYELEKSRGNGLAKLTNGWIMAACDTHFLCMNL